MVVQCAINSGRARELANHSIAYPFVGVPVVQVEGRYQPRVNCTGAAERDQLDHGGDDAKARIKFETGTDGQRCGYSPSDGDLEGTMPFTCA